MISNRGRIVSHIGKYKVVEKPQKVMSKWRGMNTIAAKQVHFGYKVPKDELWVDSNRHFWSETEKHEYIESCKEKRGLKYPKAHKIAEKYQDRSRKFVLKKFK